MLQNIAPTMRAKRLKQHFFGRKISRPYFWMT
jgi:hypothetical protein